MSTDYSQLIQNLKSRRYDETTSQNILSESFYKSVLSDSIKYAMESMFEVDRNYTFKLYSIAQRIQDLLEENLRNRKIEVEFRYTGPHASDSHIRLFDDVEMVIIPKKVGDKPSKALGILAVEIVDILDQTNSFTKIDYSDKCRILVQTPSPVCDITILPAVWVDSAVYKETRLEINRGICEYNLAKQTRKAYLPFLSISRLNTRDRRVKGGLKSLIRLVRNLIEDAPEKIDLSFEEICGLIFDIPDAQLKTEKAFLLSLLPALSEQLTKLITDDNYRRKLISPSKKEYVFHNKDEKVDELKKLKLSLDELIKQIQSDLGDAKITDQLNY